jgi:hypothetical protein
MSNFNTFAIRPGGTEEELVTMLDNYFGSEYGVKFPDGRVFKESVCTVLMGEANAIKEINSSEYLTDEEYDRMKQDVESRENHIADANKKVSPLDEYLVTCKEGFFWECDGDEIEQRERLWPVVEHMIRLAVQKHAEAVTPEPYGYAEHMSNKELFDKGNGRKECIDEINQASYKWRGV